jgi:hypothetical protein
MCYGTKSFIIQFSKARHRSCPKPDECISHPHTLIRSILLMSSHLRRSLPSVIFLQIFRFNSCMNFLSLCMCATCPAHLTLLTQYHCIRPVRYDHFRFEYVSIFYIVRGYMTYALKECLEVSSFSKSRERRS